MRPVAIRISAGNANNTSTTLRIGDAYHLLGQSWGGMLGAEFAVRRPAGLQRLIIGGAARRRR